MILSITTKGKDADKLSFLLHKSPDKFHEFTISSGKAYVFYPVYSPEEVCASLMIDLNPVDLTRGREGSSNNGIFDYVNDRPYTSSSFMTTAIAQVYSTAMSGRCKHYPNLVDVKRDFEVEITALKVLTNFEINEILEPLGYEVRYDIYKLDDEFEDWGNSKYVTLNLKINTTLSTLLKQLYVLIPVFDNNKHYYLNKDEIDKLLEKGAEWLEGHPMKEFIIRRYLNNRYLESVLDQTPKDKLKQTLNTIRLNTVAEKIKELNVDSVVDLGCGEGKLLKLIIENTNVSKVIGADIDIKSLKIASKKLKYDSEGERLQLVQSSAVYYDKRFKDVDLICLVEVIEHIDEHRLQFVIDTVFNNYKPKNIIITTPNVEYNNVYEMNDDDFRHDDHRFEWTRAEFEKWCNDICSEYGYKVTFNTVGEVDEKYGSSTQMGVFEKCV